MLFEGRFKTQDYFRSFLHLFSIPSFIFSKTGMGLFLFTLKGYFKLFIICIQRMVSLMVILFCTKCFLLVYMYIDLLKLKAYKLYRLPLKTPHKKFAISFCLFNKGRYYNWYVVIINQSLLDTAEKTLCRYPYNVPTQIIPFVKKTETQPS